MKSVWLIGAGQMSQDYIQVLQDLDVELNVIGRSQETSKKCEKATGCVVIAGGLNEYLSVKPVVCTHAIVAVGVEKLFETTKELLEYGVKNILVEKPAGLQPDEFNELVKLTKKNEANVFVAYNRRFFASVIQAKKIIEKAEGVTSFNFEFTEWAHTIAPLKKADGVKEKWFLANSTHVVDLAFYLGGIPKEIQCFTSGSLDWHPSSSVFSGAGTSNTKALFTYQANWESAGRWGVELLTKEYKLILRPMEKLQIQKRGTIPQVFDDSIDYTLDEKYKPGLYLQTKFFLDNSIENFCRLEEQSDMLEVYMKMANYG